MASLPEKYTILESQLAEDGTMGILTYSYDAEDEAWSKYYSVLSAAAVSSVAGHGATFLTGPGNYVTNKVFTHLSEDSTDTEES